MGLLGSHVSCALTIWKIREQSECEAESWLLLSRISDSVGFACFQLDDNKCDEDARISPGSGGLEVRCAAVACVGLSFMNDCDRELKWNYLQRSIYHC